MRCQRCQGLLVRETFGDLNVETTPLRTATRCINCGCIEDAVIRVNRFCRSEGTRAIPCRRRIVRKGDVMLRKGYP
ncbi:MAG: hypothetical protein OEY86_12680 [Nitrospira sp.]|nr:hypothetical protein [Nitrospira sp.]